MNNTDIIKMFTKIMVELARAEKAVGLPPPGFEEYISNILKAMLDPMAVKPNHTIKCHAHTPEDPCPVKVPYSSRMGEALTGQTERIMSGHFVIGNDEYSAAVNYCPDCGQKAPMQIKVK